MKLLTYGLLGGLCVAYSAAAQTKPTAFTCYFEPAPVLADGRTSQYLTDAIYERIVFPPECLRAQVTGRVYLSFVITSAGSVQRVSILKPLYAPFDSAVIRAVQQLRFRPAPRKHGGTSYNVPISFEQEVAWLAAKTARPHQPAPRRNSTP